MEDDKFTKPIKVYKEDFEAFEKLEQETGLRRQFLFHRMIELWIEQNGNAKKGKR